MIENLLYTDFFITKTNSIIPVLKNGKTIESKYNPEREAESIINNLDNNYNAFLVIGISSGILIDELIKRNPNSLVIGIENSNKDISFLLSNQNIKKRIENKNIILSTVSDLETTLISHYIPSKYGDLKIIEQKNWILNNEALVCEIKNKISSAIKVISSDFSVQAHFGKIWTINILNNIKFLSKIDSYNFNSNNYDISKNVYIIAAGPSLDTTIQLLLEDTNKYIIATDTAFQVLQKYNLSPDFVVSLDGQNVSHNHFMNSNLFNNTKFFLDLAGNSSAVKLINTKDISFFVSGNPLAVLFNEFTNNSLTTLNSGSGTVTIAALDLAIKIGFKKIKILGADFAYSKGKAYTKGSYLDLLYNFETNKLFSSEYNYDKLLFRTELFNQDKNVYTTEILNSYKSSLITFLEMNNCSYNYNNYIYEIKNNSLSSISSKKTNFSYEEFIEFINKLPKSDIEIALLPLISYLRKQNNYSKDIEFSDFLKLAQSFIVRYN